MPVVSFCLEQTWTQSSAHLQDDFPQNSLQPKHSWAMQLFQDSIGESLRGKLVSHATTDSFILTCYLPSEPLPYLVISGGSFSLIVLIQSTYAHMGAYTHRPWWLLTLAPRHPLELEMSLLSGTGPQHLHPMHTAKCIKHSRRLMVCHQQLAPWLKGLVCGLVLFGHTPGSLTPSSQQLINNLKRTRCSPKRKL